MEILKLCTACLLVFITGRGIAVENRRRYRVIAFIAYYGGLWLLHGGVWLLLSLTGTWQPETITLWTHLVAATLSLSLLSLFPMKFTKMTLRNREEIRCATPAPKQAAGAASTLEQAASTASAPEQVVCAVPVLEQVASATPTPKQIVCAVPALEQTAGAVPASEQAASADLEPKQVAGAAPASEQAASAAQNNRNIQVIIKQFLIKGKKREQRSKREKGNNWQRYTVWGRQWLFLLLVVTAVYAFPVLFPEIPYGWRVFYWAAALLLCQSRHLTFRNPARYGFAALPLAAITFYYLGFRAYCPDGETQPLYAALTAAGILGGLLCLFFLTGQYRFSILCGGTIYFIWTLAHCAILTFRGTPLIPSDWKNVGTAINVAGSYQFQLTRDIWIYFALLLALAVVLRAGEVPGFLRQRSRRLAAGGAFILVFALGLHTLPVIKTFSLTISPWEQKKEFQRYGHTLAYYISAMEGRVVRPSAYSEGEIAALTQEYPGQPQTTAKKPHVIAIMNEALTDVGDVGPLTVNRDYMPFIHSLSRRDDYAVGRALVSTYGGGTCNSEWEFLTGYSMEYAPGVTPYSTESFTNSYSLCAHMKAMGYRTVATHPASGENWRRNTVYPQMGFDETYFIEDYDNCEMIRGLYASDKDVYDKILERLAAADGDAPLFMFAVTVQNHGGYESGELRVGEGLPIHETALGNEGLNQFLSLMYESDKALRSFMQAVDALDEPVVVVTFGDHYPALDEEVYDALRGRESVSLKEAQTLYATPYVVHANYAIDYQEFEDYMSVNYLGANLLRATGLAMSPFYEFLLAMQETVPAVNTNGYMDAEGWHEYSETDTEAHGWLKVYNNIQYNGRFGNTVKQFFT